MMDYYDRKTRAIEGQSFPNAPISRLRYCFETDSDGLIPLSNDWPHVLKSIGSLPTLFVQVDNFAGRMSQKMTGEGFLASAFGDPGPSGFLLGPQFGGWFYATARLENCRCCGSPGGVTFFSEMRLPFMQICPSNKVSPSQWAGVLSRIAIKPFEQKDQRYYSGDSLAGAACPGDCYELRMRGYGLPRFLDLAAKSYLPLEFTIRTPQVDLRQSYTIQNVDLNADRLECRGKGAGFSLNLQEIRRSVISMEFGFMSLLLLGCSDRVLFEIRAQSTEEFERAWQELVLEFQ